MNGFRFLHPLRAGERWASLEITDDAMAPRYEASDLLLVDRDAAQDFSLPGDYLLSTGGPVLLRQVTPLAGGLMRLRSYEGAVQADAVDLRCYWISIGRIHGRFVDLPHEAAGGAA